MGFFPFQPQFLPLSGGTVSGALTVTGLLTTQLGITNSGAAISSAAQISATGVNNIQAGGSVTAALGSLNTGTAGQGLTVKGGSNAKIGVSSAMVAGTTTVANTSVTANSKIFLQNVTPGGTIGTLEVGTITAGTSFVINSSNAADTSTVQYMIVEQS